MINTNLNNAHITLIALINLPAWSTTKYKPGTDIKIGSRRVTIREREEKEKRREEKRSTVSKKPTPRITNIQKYTPAS